MPKKECTCGYAIGHPLVSKCTCKPTEWVGLNDTAKLFFIRNAPKWTTLKLIEAVEAEIKEKNGMD